MIDDIQAKYKAESFKVVNDNSPVKLSGDRMDVRVRETNLGGMRLLTHFWIMVSLTLHKNQILQ